MGGVGWGGVCGEGEEGEGEGEGGGESVNVFQPRTEHSPAVVIVRTLLVAHALLAQSNAVF